MCAIAGRPRQGRMRNAASLRPATIAFSLNPPLAASPVPRVRALEATKAIQA